MSETVTPQMILRSCGEKSPAAWYPSDFTKETGVPREEYDHVLDALRMAGLLELTEWESGVGQGYRLTAQGRDVVASPQVMAKMRDGVRSPTRAPTPAGQPTRWDRGETIRRSLLAAPPIRLVPILIGLNLLVFIAGAVICSRGGGSAEAFIAGGGPGFEQALITTGAIHGALLADGQWWRLLTSCFVHIGGMHLMVNMLSLFILGRVAEPVWGRWRFAVIYLYAGVGGSWAAMVWGPNVLLAGASGAIWGIMASLIAWLLLNRSHLPAQLVSMWMRQFGFILLLNVFITFSVPNISASGHFGGGAVGFLVASLLNWHRFGSRAARVTAVAALVMIPIVQFAALKQAMNESPEWRELVHTHLKEEFAAGPAGSIRALSEELDEFRETRIVPIINQDREDRDPADVKRLDRDLMTQLNKIGRIRLEVADYMEAGLLQDLKVTDGYLEAEEAYFETAHQMIGATGWDESADHQFRDVHRRWKEAYDRWKSQ